MDWWIWLLIAIYAPFIAWYMGLKLYLMLKYPDREYAYLALAVMIPSVWLAFYTVRLFRLPMPKPGDMKEAARVD